MASSRDDFIIAIRSAFLKKSTQQKFSLLTLVFVSIFTIILSSFDLKFIRYLKAGISEAVYRSSFIVSIPENFLTDLDQREIYINPTGQFIIGGPDGDTGLTGRKIIVDTYGGAAPHGGGAFSGKDPSKVDRSGAYMARYIAKNLVAAEIAEKCTIQLAYIIGVAEPISIFLDTHGTSKVEAKKLINNYRINGKQLFFFNHN